MENKELKVKDESKCLLKIEGGVLYVFENIRWSPCRWVGWSPEYAREYARYQKDVILVSDDGSNSEERD